MNFIPFLLQAQQTAEGVNPAAGAGGGLGMFIPLILIVVIMYFFMIRPQNKKQKETQKMLDALKKGDKVITIGGIHGVVSQVKENTVVIKVDDSCKIEFNRTAISTVLTDKPAEPEVKEKKSFFGFGKKNKEEKETAEVKEERTELKEVDENNK